MENAPNEQDIKDLYLASPEDLKLLRWNAFLNQDTDSLRAIRDEALKRADIPGFNSTEYQKIADGCTSDIEKLGA